MMAGEKLLIIEDDPTLLRGLRDNFSFEKYHVSTAADGESGLRAAIDQRPDLILLDIMLPAINGFEICRLVRKQGLEMPIIMLTAKGQEQDIVLGLNLGADDYVTKPFGIKQLLARVRAHLRRRRQEQAVVFHFGRYVLDAGAKQLRRGEAIVELTPKEYGLLELLVRRTGRAFTRDELLRRVWGDGLFVTGRSVDRCVATLRAKIEADAASPRFIQTVREVGYRFDSD